MNGWNTTFLLGWPIFRCYEYVSFREVTTRRHWASFSPCCLHFGSSCYKKPFIAVDPIWHSKPCSANQRWKANHPGVSLVPRLSAKHGPLVTRPSHRYCHWKINNPRRRVWEHYLWCWQEQKGDEQKGHLETSFRNMHPTMRKLIESKTLQFRPSLSLSLTKETQEISETTSSRSLHQEKQISPPSLPR